MCTPCRKLYRRKLYWTSRRIFADAMSDHYNLFRAVKDGNFAFVHDAVVVDETVVPEAVAAKKQVRSLASSGNVRAPAAPPPNTRTHALRPPSVWLSLHVGACLCVPMCCACVHGCCCSSCCSWHSR
jgi:hypothetical protein